MNTLKRKLRSPTESLRKISRKFSPGKNMITKYNMVNSLVELCIISIIAAGNDDEHDKSDNVTVQKLTCSLNSTHSLFCAALLKLVNMTKIGALSGPCVNHKANSKHSFSSIKVTTPYKFFHALIQNMAGKKKPSTPTTPARTSPPPSVRRKRDSAPSRHRSDRSRSSTSREERHTPQTSPASSDSASHSGERRSRRDSSVGASLASPMSLPIPRITRSSYRAILPKPAGKIRKYFINQTDQTNHNKSLPLLDFQASAHDNCLPVNNYQATEKRLKHRHAPFQQPTPRPSPEPGTPTYGEYKKTKSRPLLNGNLVVATVTRFLSFFLSRCPERPAAKEAGDTRG